ncbi:MAG TPA: hypothetical protein VHO69_08725 [Phototrophicaceae bacterium]|nr:hypothetical protein [Phototrophicaceae bacterium]
MMDYEHLIYKLESLDSLLRELDAAGMYQGEHTIVYTGRDRIQRILHIHIDGTDLQMSAAPLLNTNSPFSWDTSISQD